MTTHRHMITVIEGLFGVAIACSVAAIITFAMKRRQMAQRFGTLAVVAGVIAVLLEVYVRATE